MQTIQNIFFICLELESKVAERNILVVTTANIMHSKLGKNESAFVYLPVPAYMKCNEVRMSHMGERRSALLMLLHAD